METTTLPRRRRRLALVPVAVACCHLLQALNGPAAAEEAPVSLRIVPERVTLHGARAAQRFVILGGFADGLERDVTSQSDFSLSNPLTAALDPLGRVVAQADGELLPKSFNAAYGDLPYEAKQEHYLT